MKIPKIKDKCQKIKYSYEESTKISIIKKKIINLIEWGTKYVTGSSQKQSSIKQCKPGSTTLFIKEMQI